MAIDVDDYSFGLGGSEPLGRGSVLPGSLLEDERAGSGGSGVEPLATDASTPLDGDAAIPPALDGGTDDVVADASPTPLEPVDACVPRWLYRDRDVDGFGGVAPEDLRWACPEAGWVERSGDCHDATPSPADPAGDVWPGQTAFFAVGYPVADLARPLSFDYDCSGIEDPDPANIGSGPTLDCGSLGLLCSGQAYLPVDGRVGDGVDARCGSGWLRVCEPSVLSCEAVDYAVPDQPFRCR